MADARRSEIVPSAAQARLLAAVHDRDRDEYGPRRFISRGAAVWTHSEGSGYFLGRFRVETTTVCVRRGWLDIGDGSEAWVTEAGAAALETWRALRLTRPAEAAPRLEGREREIVDLAQRAHDLGYTLAPLKNARVEARRLRRAGWLDTCWIANNAHGLVPTPMAVVEIRPDAADVIA